MPVLLSMKFKSYGSSRSLNALSSLSFLISLNKAAEFLFSIFIFYLFLAFFIIYFNKRVEKNKNIFFFEDLNDSDIFFIRFYMRNTLEYIN